MADDSKKLIGSTIQLITKTNVRFLLTLSTFLRGSG